MDEDTIGTIHRPAKASAVSMVGTSAGTYTNGDKKVAYAEAKGAEANAEYGIFGAKAQFLSAGANAAITPYSVSAEAKAEYAGAEATIGGLKLKAALGVDTGINLGVDQSVGVKLAGCGVTVGRKIGFSLFNNEISLKFW